MAYVVSERVHEVGIRLALGARSAHIQNMVIIEGTQPTLAGVALVLLAAFGFARGRAGFLFGVKHGTLLFFV
jgi:ABC-type antimicrobial peptide transport system permease subunit